MSTKEWRALDHCDHSWRGSDWKNDAVLEQDAEQKNVTKQSSEEWIIIKDSEYVNVETTDTQLAASLQAALQGALLAIIRIAILDGEQAEDVLQDFRQVTKIRQSNRQKTIIECSKYVDIETEDLHLAINLQLLAQLLGALVIVLDVG